MSGYDFSGSTDLDLVVMQKQVRNSGEDKEFLDAILVELGKRQVQLGKENEDETGQET